MKEKNKRRLIFFLAFFWAVRKENIGEGKKIRGTTEYYRILQSITEYYGVLWSTTEYYGVLRSTTEYYGALRSTTEYYGVLQKPHGSTL